MYMITYHVHIYTVNHCVCNLAAMFFFGSNDEIWPILRIYNLSTENTLVFLHNGPFFKYWENGYTRSGLASISIWSRSDRGKYLAIMCDQNMSDCDHITPIGRYRSMLCCSTSAIVNCWCQQLPLHMPGRGNGCESRAVAAAAASWW